MDRCSICGSQALNRESDRPMPALLTLYEQWPTVNTPTRVEYLWLTLCCLDISFGWNFYSMTGDLSAVWTSISSGWSLGVWCWMPTVWSMWRTRLGLLSEHLDNSSGCSLGVWCWVRTWNRWRVELSYRMIIRSALVFTQVNGRVSENIPYNCKITSFKTSKSHKERDMKTDPENRAL